MKPEFNAVTLSVLLLIAGSLAHADGQSNRSDRSERQTHREIRPDSRQQERSTATSERQIDTESRQSLMDAQFQAESGKRFGHLSADERRALRRQINEAGQDIYSRKH